MDGNWIEKRLVSTTVGTNSHKSIEFQFHLLVDGMEFFVVGIKIHMVHGCNLIGMYSSQEGGECVCGELKHAPDD